MNLPTVAIIGRPNVGKSSLFNRFLKRRVAVVDPTSGVTRDRNYAVCDWNGRDFRLVDTGGMVPDSRDLMERLITDQSDFAVNEADLVLFVVDTQVGVADHDLALARRLQKAKKTTILVANKADNQDLTNQSYEFMQFGFGEPMAISATEGLGIGELLDELVKRLPPLVPNEEADDTIRVALVGRPNVGKSSFINKLLGEDRLIVTEIAGTTRDSVDTDVVLDGQRYIVVDTAGLRRKYKVQENIEFYTNLRTIRAVEGCDVAIILIDGVDGVTSQDQRVIADVLEARRGAVLAVNKWDLVEKDEKTADKYTIQINENLARFAYLPIIYISALSGQRVNKVMQLVKKVYEEQRKRVPTPQLNDLLQRAVGRRKPPALHGKYIQIKYVAQTEVNPPTFIFFANHPELLDKGYLAYLTNQLRDEFGFEGVPIRVKAREK